MGPPQYALPLQVFELSTSKWGHSRVTRVMASFLPIFQLAMPFRSRLKSQALDRQTDRQTTAINPLCPTL